MLHILLTLLKIIGILILSIIGICILLVLLVIFTPLRYELNGDCKGDLDSLNINARFSFFIHLIMIRIQYHNKKLEWQAKLAWKHLSSENSEKNENSESTKTDKVETVENTSVVNQIPGNKQAENKVQTKTIKKEPVKEKLTASTKKIHSVDDNTNSQEKEEKREKARLNKKINSVIEKIKCTSAKICDMISLIKEKSELITDFLSDEQHKAALMKLLKELKKLFKKLIPKKILGSITFGFENPGITGKVLAGVSLFYPYIKDNLSIYADFEEKKLVGDLYIKGKIRISMFLSFLLHLILNKNVRVTISHILKLVKKLKQGGK